MYALERLTLAAQDAFFALTSCVCAPSATIKLNGRTFKIVKLLGEGGFSFVYLAQDPSSGRLFALKKIRCPLGSESVREALREVEAYRRFRHPNIIRCLDSCVVQDKEGDGKAIYLFLPYYSRGNLQDAVNVHAVNGDQFAEREMLRLFLGIAKAVQAMHDYHPSSERTMYPPAGATRTLDSADDAGGAATGSTETLVLKGRSRSGRGGPTKEFDLDDEDEDEHAMHDTDGQERPLIGALSSHSTVTDDASDPPSPHPHPISTLNPHPPLSAPSSSSNRFAEAKQPWAHRDLKPANVMLSDDGTPILMDFGSAIPARVPCPTRSTALAQQDIAAEHSSMPYRAPELFDVKTGSTLTEAVDIWSLGCLLYCLAYGNSPFETPETVEQGGSMALAVMNGGWKFPVRDRGYSEGFKELIKKMLVVEPDGRPTIGQVVEFVDKALIRLA